MASTYLTMTPTATDQGAAWTFSTWLKRGGITAVQCIFSAGTVSSHRFQLNFQSDDTIGIFIDMVGVSSSDRKTTTKYRDPGAWYHILMNWNGTTTTLYVNGVETSMSGSTTGDSSSKIVAGTNIQHKIGAHFDASDKFDGEMAHTHFSSSTSYAPTVFGETDATSGIWVAKTSPSVTYGDNGFFLKYQDTSNFGDDSSGETNDFAVAAGTMTQTKDTPDNNFATLNSIDNYLSDVTFSNGNNTIATSASKVASVLSTIGMTSGKWYFEIKPTARAGSADYLIGICSTQSTATTDELGNFANDWGYYSSTGGTWNDNTNTAYGDTYDTDDIIGVAVDLTNSKLYFSKNGTWQNSGVPTSGATGTGAVSITAVASTPLGVYFAGLSYYTAASATFNINFGNGYFGTTSHGETNADDAGIGLFKYDVPAGYYALCTTNLGDQS